MERNKIWQTEEGHQKDQISRIFIIILDYSLVGFMCLVI